MTLLLTTIRLCLILATAAATATIAITAPADESWTRHTIDDSSRGADGIRLADVNGDDLQDIATGWEEGGIVRAYLHPGRKNAQKKWPAVTVGSVNSPEDAVFADLDGDGAIDIVSACEGKTRSLFVHWAPQRIDYQKADHWHTEVFPSTRNEQSWMFTLPMDIDGKNGIDLVVGSKGANAGVGWLESPEDPRSIEAWKYHRLEDAGWIMSLIAADMDADGDHDILVSDRRGDRRGVYWLEHPSDVEGSPWHRHDIGGSDRDILFISIGDLNHDGQLDVVASAKDTLISFTRTTDAWDETLIPLPTGVGTGKSAAICDIDLDGKNDIAFSCENANGTLSGIRWLSRAANGQWIDHEVAGTPGTKFDQVVPCDIDGDGDIDLMCCEERENLGVFWYENPTR